MADEKGSELGCCVVLGASGDIGSCVARRLAYQGRRLLLAAPESDRLSSLADELRADSMPTDATSFEEVDACLQAAQERYGRVGGVVNCVGSVLLKPAHLTTADELHETLSLNLVSAFSVVRAAAQKMDRSGGSIVLISSSAARIGLVNHEAIAAAKAGIEGLTRSAAATYARRGLRVNAVAPGLVKTKLTERIWSSERAAAHSQALHALGRLGEPDDVASLIAWLLDPHNAWITGEVIGVDGGLGRTKLA
ncbi:3-oxoacyl-[acyl-carrier-protein] reductase FabG [Posidoniimonas corsicana]|uniref:3-oxoacyl-[acyl-carrier-protein] reductase FabG n=1 Tax=Posidoniimonas corsicana TaxID=1938618 RepID=A0A5C5VDA0_9BACT|nr:SDR family oxidoreductase [Posidoniimonas corsicana]TWT36568.1 3-oxoacyl-[acyl-carrier-protein] reductase FabG [Posidoniimonas corsicana]